MISSRSSKGAKALFIAFVVKPLHVVEPDSECLGDSLELRAQGHAAHEPVVGVDSDAIAQASQKVDGMLLDRRGRSRLDVAGGAHLERHATVAHKRGQAAELDRSVSVHRDVVDDSRAVTESLGAAPLERLPDRRQAEALAGVDRDVEVLPLDQLERVEVPRGREAGLRPGDVETDDALVSVPHGELRGLDRAGRLAHGGDEQLHRDRPALQPRSMLALSEARQDRGHHLVEREAALGGELRRIPDLGIHDVVGGEVLGALGGHSLERIARLEEGDRVAESLEVELETLTVGTAGEPAGELGRIARRQARRSQPR